MLMSKKTSGEKKDLTMCRLLFDTAKQLLYSGVRAPRGPMCEPNATRGWAETRARWLGECGDLGLRHSEADSSVAEQPGLPPPSVPVTQTQVACMPQPGEVG